MKLKLRWIKDLFILQYDRGKCAISEEGEENPHCFTLDGLTNGK